MENFELTFRFDNLEQTLTRHNGLPIIQLARILQALSRALSKDENNLVLSEIKGNCYAPVISTPSQTEYEKIKTLHAVIAEQHYSVLTKSERAYASVLAEVVKTGIILNVYDTQKTFFKTIDQISDAIVYKHFYATTSKKGYLTKIGGRNLDSKNTIFITSYPNEIEINAQQDATLKQYYKESLIEFYITEKVNKETNKIDQAVLDDFKIIDQTDNFYERIKGAREKYGTYFTEINEENDD